MHEKRNRDDTLAFFPVLPYNKISRRAPNKIL